MPDGRWNFQGATAATFRAARLGPLTAELVGGADWTSHDQARGTTAVTGTGRLAFEPGRGSRLWLGRGTGVASSLGHSRAVQRLEEGAARVHLDIETDDVPAEVARLERLGATVVQERSNHVIMADPGGVVFCVVPVQTGDRFVEDSLEWE